MIPFACTGCSHKLQLDDSLSGSAFRCPVCHAESLVPAAEAAAIPPPVPQDQATLPPAPPDAAATVAPEAAQATAAVDARAPAGYAIEKELGRGGMGVVYLARSLALRRPCALKMILSGAHSGSAEVERFRTEAQAIARLSHPGIVQVFEVGEHDGRPFMALEFCGGGSLDGKLAKNPLPPAEAARLVRSLAEAMQAAHDAKVIHRDLKPANVLLTADGTPKVTDFGLAKKLDEEGQTRTGSVMGTPSYMAPEQAEGKKDVGPLADVYALGAILYECLTGRPPFKAATALDTIMQVVSEEPVPPRQLNAKVPRDLATITLKCLRKEPNKRYASAGHLAADLGRYLNGEPIKGRPVGAVERGYRWVRRNPVVAGLSAFALLALTLGVAFSTHFAVKAGREAEQARAEALRSDTARHSIQMDLALRSWQDGDLDRVGQILADVGPAFRECWETRFLAGLSRRTARPIVGHPGDVRAVCFSRDGKTLVSGGAIHGGPGPSGATKLWDAATGQEKAGPDGLTACVYAMALSPNGDTLAVAGHDGRIHLWDPREGGQRLRVITAHLNEIIGAVCFSPRGDLLASAGGQSVKLWDARTGALRLTLGQGVPCRAVAFSADGETLVSGGNDRVLRWWDVRTGKPIRSQPAHFAPIDCVAVSPNGLSVVTGSGWPENSVKVWDAKTGANRLTMRGHANHVLSVSFSPDGLTVLSSGYDHLVKLWDAQTGQVRRTLAGHTQSMLTGCHACFGPDGNTVLSGSGAGEQGSPTLLLWDLRAEMERLALRGHGAAVHHVCFSPDGKALVTAGKDATVRLWDAATGAPGPVLRGHRAAVNDVCFSPDGKTLVSGGDDGTVVLWDAASGKQGKALTHEGDVKCVGFSPDGTVLLSGTTPHTPLGQQYRPGGDLKLWDARTGDVLFTLKGHSYGVTSARFSPDGRTVAGKGEGGVQLWDVRTGQPTRLIRLVNEAVPAGGFPPAATCLGFSPDGERLIVGVAGDASPGLRLFDLRTGALLFSVKERLPVTSVQFSPDGRAVIASTGGFYNVPGELKVYDVRTGQPKLTIKRHASLVNHASFSPDGDAVATASDDGTVKVFDAR